MSPLKYELGFYIPEDDILLSLRRETLKSYTVFIKFVEALSSVHSRADD
jgi:hypothetical protein